MAVINLKLLVKPAQFAIDVYEVAILLKLCCSLFTNLVGANLNLYCSTKAQLHHFNLSNLAY